MIKLTGKMRTKKLILKVAKKVNLDIYIGEKFFKWDYDQDRDGFQKRPHWHLKSPPFVLYRDEY
jgi:hypothetical protein